MAVDLPLEQLRPDLQAAEVDLVEYWPVVYLPVWLVLVLFVRRLFLSLLKIC